MDDQHRTCPKCGGTHLQSKGASTEFVAARETDPLGTAHGTLTTIRRFRCRDCGELFSDMEERKI
jgi:predicted RNA-binding Zn-ribbon protein involved in translation (DUF1610 family)